MLQVILNTDLFVDPGRRQGCRHRHAGRRSTNPTALQTEDANNIYRYTLLFNVFVWMQIWNEFNCRSVRFHRSPFRGLADSRTFLAIVGVIVVLQVLLIQFGGQVFSTVALSWDDWLLSIGLGATVIVIGAADPDRRPADLVGPLRLTDWSVSAISQRNQPVYRGWATTASAATASVGSSAGSAVGAACGATGASIGSSACWVGAGATT